MRHLCCLFLLLAVDVQADSRQVYSATSPPWMAAVGKLDVPGQKLAGNDLHHLDEHCSATLVGATAARDSRYVLSAWHCLEYYRDLSKPIVFSLPNAGIRREAFVVASGGGMSADWALLRLQRSIPREQVQAFPAWETVGDTGGALESVSGGTILTMAGYSSDERLGRGGEVLTYDAKCQALEQTPNLVTTDCVAFKGASGGPVVARMHDDLRLLGVISAGDSVNRSLYAPARLFVASLRLHLSPPPQQANQTP